MSRRSDRLAALAASPMHVYWYQQRRSVRVLVAAALPFTLAGIPVAAAHGVPLALAVLAGVVVACAEIGLAATWHRPWSSRAAVLVHLLTVWPALVWVYYVAFPVAFLLPVLVCVYLDRLNRRTFLAQENAFRAQDGKPPYECTQEQVEEAYRAARRARGGVPAR